MIKILIIKTSSMGDVIHTLPAITDLYNNIDNIQIDWVVEEGFINIADRHFAVNRVIPIALRRWRRNFLSLNTYKEIREFINSLRAEAYDYIIDAQGLLKSVLITSLVKKNKRRVIGNSNNKNQYGFVHGLDSKSIRGKYISWLYDNTYNISKQLHAIHRLKILFSNIFDYSVSLGDIDYGLESSIKKPQVNNNDSGKITNKYLVFLHCTTWDSKKWPVDYWYALIKFAVNNGFEVKLNAGNNTEYAYTKKLVNIFIADNSEYNGKITAMQPQSISSLINVLSNSEGVVSVDTGLGHLAAALNKPGVGVFGATNTKLTGFLSDKFINLNSDYQCAPCLLRECNINQAKPPCYQSVTPKIVWGALENILVKAEVAYKKCEVK